MKHFICAILVITVVACESAVEKVSINMDKSEPSFTAHTFQQKLSPPTASSMIFFKGIFLNSTDIAINGKNIYMLKVY